MADITHTANAIDHAQADPHQVHEHEVHGGPKTYALVLAALLVFTAITVAASRINFGSNMTNVIIAMLIASIKASLVVLFFMHVKYSSRMTWVFAGAGLLWLGILMGLTLTDYFSRGWAM